MKSLAVVLALGLGVGGCAKRTSNLYVRYSGVLLVVGGAALIAGPYLNGENNADQSDPKGFDTRLPGVGVAAVGAGLVIASLLVHPVDRPVDLEAQHHREIVLRVDALLHQAEAAAARSDCVTVTLISPQLDKLDPGVGAVLRADVEAARCLAAQPMSAWLRRD